MNLRMRPKNNPKNRRGLLEHQRRQLELAKRTESDARRRVIESNLEKWIDSLPNNLKNALPNNLPKGVIDKIKKTSLKPPYDKYTIISSESIQTAKFTSYALIYALIKGGFVTPSQVKSTDIMEGYNNINGMFNSRKWKDYFFDANAKVLLIEGSSKGLTLLGSKGEDQFWRELIEFTKNDDRLVIITYSTEEQERKRELFIPSLTSDKDLNYRLIKNSVFVKLTEQEEDKIKNG